MDLPSTPFVPAIALRWQKNVSDLQEYKVIREGNVFQSGLSHSTVFSSEFERAQQLKEQLALEYHGKNVEEVFSGEELGMESGSAFCICSKHEIRNPLPFQGTDEQILSDLTLIHGIGPVTAQRLKNRGYRTIRDLLQHPKYRKNANHLLSHVEQKAAYLLMEWIGRRHPKSHPLNLAVAGSIEKEDFSFLDIETLGIFSRPIILLGLAHWQNNQVHVKQYLLRDIEEEPAALEAAFAHLNKSTAFVTFNGKSFDIPFLQERAAYYGMLFPTEVVHFDLLHFSRKRWKDVFLNCRLQTLERSLFGIEREMDIPSALVPEFYEAFLTTGSPGLLVPIVEHNRQDVLSLVHLFYLLMEESACQ